MKLVDLPKTEPSIRRWTGAEYSEMASLGFFEGQHVELIEGEILIMTPQNNAHAIAVTCVHDVLKLAFGDGFWIRTQMPLKLSESSEPEPDVAVVRGRPRDFSDHPASALMVVEVSQATLTNDRSRKSSLYAAAGIDEYWIVNLIDGQLEVQRDPVAADTPSGFTYATRTIHKPSDVVTPLALPAARIIVRDLLP